MTFGEFCMVSILVLVMIAGLFQWYQNFEWLYHNVGFVHHG